MSFLQLRAPFRKTLPPFLEVIASDTITLTENVVLSVSAPVISDLTISVSDTITTTENRVIDIPITFAVSDTITTTDPSIIRLESFISSVSDTVSITENVVRELNSNRSVSDTITITESPTIELNSFIAPSDSITLSESVALTVSTPSFSVSDTITITESIGRVLVSFITLSDSITVTENLTLRTFATTPVLDNFNRADASTIGPNWSLVTDFGLGGPHDQGITGNKLYNPATIFTNYIIMYWNPTTFGPDVEAYMTIVTKPTADDNFSLYARLTNIGATFNGYGLSTIVDNNTIEITRIDNGSGTLLGSAISQTISSGDRVGMQIIGNNIYAWYDSGSGWQNIATRTDSTYTAPGYIGFYLPDNSTDGRWDDFGGGSTNAYFVTASDTVTTSESVSSRLASSIVVSDTVTVSESKSVAPALSITVSDSITLSEVFYTGSFVTTASAQFRLDGNRLRFVGVNKYPLVIGSMSQADVAAYFSACQSAGIKVVRTWCFDGSATPTDSDGNFRYLYYPLGTNLITNPSFETDTTGYVLDGDFTRSSSSAEDGTYSIHQVSTSGYQGMHYTATVSASTDYVWTFWYKLTWTPDGDGSHLGPTVRIEDHLNADWIDDGILANTTTWKRHQVAFNSGSNTQVRLSIYNFGGNNDAFYDNFHLGLQQTPALTTRETTFAQLDMVLNEARKYNVRLILSLADNPTYGTKLAYINWANSIYGAGLSTAYPYSGFFDSSYCRTLYKDFVDILLARVNTINARTYKNDDTIFSWELGNELRYDLFTSEGGTQNTAGSTDIAAVTSWIQDVGGHIQSNDEHHLVGYGDQGHTWQWVSGDTVSNGSGYGVDYNLQSALAEIDYLDFHTYPDQSDNIHLMEYGQRLGYPDAISGNGYRAQLRDFVDVGKANGKPVVCGEVGFIRETIGDNTYFPLYPRYKTFGQIFDEIFKEGGDGVLIWSGEVTDGGSYSVNFTGSWDGTTTNLNYDDRPLARLITQENNSTTFTADLPVDSESDSITVSESKNIALVHQIHASDTITISEAINTALVHTISVSDTITITEPTKVELNSFITLSDSITLTESTNLALVHQISVSDTITATENTIANLGITINKNDTITVTESVTVAITTNTLTVAVSDSITITESVTGSVIYLNIIDSYSESNAIVADVIDGGAGDWDSAGQSFIANGTTLDSAQLYLSKLGSPTGTAVVKIYAHTGTFGTSSKPTGSVLATSSTIDVSTLPAELFPTLKTFNFSGADRVVLTDATKYVLTIEYTGGNASNGVEPWADDTSPSHPGNYSLHLVGGAWSAFASSDMVFYVYGEGFATHAASVSDSIIVSENVKVELNSFNTISDTVTVSENVKVELTSLVSVSDTVTTSEAITRQLVSFINTSDTIAITESTTARVFYISIIDSYSETNQNVSDHIANGISAQGDAQSFTGTGQVLDSARWYVSKFGSPTGSVVVKIYAHTGVFGTSSSPGTLLATADNFDISTLSTSFTLPIFNFSGTNRITLANGTKYVVSVEYTGGDGSNYLIAGFDSTSPTHAGSFSQLETGSWVTVSTFDMCFYVYGEGFVTPEITVSDSITVSESVKVELNSFVTLSDTITTTDTPSVVLVGASIAVSDAITVSESLHTELESSITVSDSITVTENVLALTTDPQITVSDSITVSEVIQDLLESQVQVSDTISLSDADSVVLPISITVSDTITVTESVTVNVFFPIVVSDTITITESNTVRVSDPQVAVSDTITTTDVANIAFVRIFQTSDSVSVSEAVFMNPPHLPDPAPKLIMVDGKLAYLIVNSGIPQYTFV